MQMPDAGHQMPGGGGQPSMWLAAGLVQVGWLARWLKAGMTGCRQVYHV